jgi:ABC-type sugar transport system ATPase subunit
LSGGNQQKVALGKWLACGARLLILVEPTQGIDVGVKFEIYDLVAQLSGTGVAILLVSSELPEILGLAHRILVMRAGRVVAELEGERTNSEEVLRYALGEVNK